MIKFVIIYIYIFFFSATDSDSDNYAEAEDGGLDPAEETLRLAKDWTRKYGSSYSTDSQGSANVLDRNTFLIKLCC